MNHKILILYRYNNFFTDLDDFIQTYKLKTDDLTIYNCTQEDIDYKNVIKSGEKIETIIKSIYHDNNGTNCIILDTCIKYSDFDIEDIIKQRKSYCIAHNADFRIPIILNKVADINNLDILIDYDTDYDDYIICEGIIDTMFYKNFFNKLSANNLIFASILNEEISCVDDFRLSDEKTKIFFKLFKLYHIADIPDNLIVYILVNNTTDLHMVFTLIDKILKNKPVSPLIMDVMVSNFAKYQDRIPFITFNNYDIYVIYEYILNYFLNKPLFMISDIPNQVLTGHNNEIYKHYPVINTEEEEISLPLLLESGIMLETPTTVNISDNKIDITNKAVVARPKQILIAKSITPLSFSLWDSANTIISYANHLHYKDYILKGQFINFNNYLVGLLEEKNKSYKLIILNHHTLKLEHITNNFIINNNSVAISLYKNEEGIFIISHTDEGRVFKCKIDLDTLIVDILHNKNILSASPFSFNIELKNAIGVSIVDFDLISKCVYKTHTFYNLPTDQKYFTTVAFNPKQKILEIDNKILYINEFIFLNDNIASNVEKTADVFFHTSARNTELYTKCIELQISTSNIYNECKYYVIEQCEFEKMDCLEVSNIIKSRCLIISLIDEQLLSQDKITSNYTTNESLIKLFLINIVKNKSYVQFMFDKLIHSKEYLKRKEYMTIDIQNIEHENNIYDCILESINKDSNFGIELNNKDTELLKIVKSKILREVPEKIYKNILDIVKYVIYNNYSITIGFIDIDNNFIEENNYKNILQILFKINWLGKIDFNVNINSNTVYQLYVMKKRADISSLSFVKNTLLYLIEENLLLKI